MLPRIACARQPPVPGTRAVCRAVLTSFHLSDTAYGLNQLRYDLASSKATDCYSVTAPATPTGSRRKGVQIALLLLSA